MYSNELYHHGVKGMKWGVRRYQKKDGSLTSAGRKRYDDDSPTKETSASAAAKRRNQLVKRYAEETAGSSRNIYKDGSSVFDAEDVKESVAKARTMSKEMDSLKNKIESKHYWPALEKYKKDHPDMDDAEYGFDHYYWPSSKEKQAASAEYKSTASQARKEYSELVTSIGRKITEGFSDQPISGKGQYAKAGMTYLEYAIVALPSYLNYGYMRL